MLGFILVISGFIIFSIGLTGQLIKAKRDKSIKKFVSKGDTKIEKEYVKHRKNKEKGDMFENFVVQKFPQKIFSLFEARSDKIFEGIYPESNRLPDLLYRFNLGDYEELLAVECKYRSSFFNNHIRWAEEYQVRNYYQYQDKKNIRVFVVIGVGNHPNNPDDLFVIPLENIKETELSLEFLKNYRKPYFKTSSFHYNFRNNKLT